MENTYEIMLLKKEKQAIKLCMQMWLQHLQTYTWE